MTPVMENSRIHRVMAMAISELTGHFYGTIHSINGVLLVLITGKGP